jgi:hypothetical protein
MKTDDAVGTPRSAPGYHAMRLAVFGTVALPRKIGAFHSSFLQVVPIIISNRIVPDHIVRSILGGCAPGYHIGVISGCTVSCWCHCPLYIAWHTHPISIKDIFGVPPKKARFVYVSTIINVNFT